MTKENNMFNIPDIKKMYEYETGFHLTANSERYGKFITHYEAYKMIQDVPGEIVECGVYKGTSIVRFASFRNMFETADSRKIIGFDNFNSIYPDTVYEEDHEQRQNWLNSAGPDSVTVEQLSTVFDNLGLNNYDFVEGDIVKTLPAYVKENPQLKVALLNIDIDFVEATYCSLEYLYDRICPGGVVLFDNYGAFHGDTFGADKFFKDRGIVPRFEKFSFTSRPCFIRR